MTSPNPYTTFVRSLSDEQLDNLIQLNSQVDAYYGDLERAAEDEAETRERYTKVTFYTPHIENFKRILAAEKPANVDFPAIVANRLAHCRFMLAWSHELENALKVLIIEMVEQLEQKP